jgi:lipopolysaccharide export system permease protein
MLLRYHEKFAIPMACFALGILAIPLGLQSNTERRSRGIITGLFLFLSYYMMFSVGWSMGESGTYPPVIGMWLPNVITGAIGIYLFLRAAKDRRISFDFITYRLKNMFKDKR